MEAYGAAGGDDDSRGGYGGYVKMYTYLEKDTKLYVTCGQKGWKHYAPPYNSTLGEKLEDNPAYNGGARASNTKGVSGVGGGATSIALSNHGELKDFADCKNDVLMVAGGGAGGSSASSGQGGVVLYTGSGTNYSVTNGADTSLLNGVFALGSNPGTNDGGGGGGGWIGGKSGLDTAGNSAGGGASFINTSQRCIPIELVPDSNTGDGYVHITSTDYTEYYTISYDYDGGSADNPISYSVTQDSFQLNNPQKEGYTFLGWTGSNGDVPQKTVTIEKGSTQNLSFKANWQINYYYLDLNSILDGSENTQLPNGCTCDLYINGKLEASGISDVWKQYPYGTVYEFKNFKTKDGLALSSTAANAVGGYGTTVQPFKGIVKGYYNSSTAGGITFVYAVFNTKTITTTFHRNISVTDTVTDMQKFTYGVSGQSFSDKGWSYEGHTLLGWAYSNNATEAYHTPLNGVIDTWINSHYPSVDLYAVWQTNTYTNTLSHWAYGFKNQEGNNEAKTCYKLRTVTFTEEYRSKYSFSDADLVEIPNGFTAVKGIGMWSDSQSYSGGHTFSESFTQRAEAMHFETFYNPINYTITYNLNGGTNNSSNPSTYNVLYGVSLKAPYKDGFDFEGWYTADGNKITGINEGCNATFSSADDLYTKLAARTTGNITVTAKWKARSNDIKYVVETEYPSWAGDQLHAGGTVSASDETVSGSNAPVGSTATITNKFNFDGWYSSSGELITKETTIKPLNTNADKKGSFTKPYLGGQGTYDADTDTYSVLVDLSKISSIYWSGLGCGVYHDCPTPIPWNNWYIAEFEVWSPVDATLVADINNHPYDGSSNWNGNDNDNVSTRSSTSKNLKANTWTKMTIWYQNSSSLNTGHKALMDTHSIDIHYDNSLGNQTFKIRGYKAAVYSTLIKELDTFTAKFSPWQHTVVYDANGGVGAPASFRKCTWLGRWISTTIPTRTGYTFTSWNTQKDGSGTSYQPGDNYPPDQNGGTVTLYAQWSYDPVTIKVPQILIGDASGSSSFRVKCDDIKAGNIIVSAPASFVYKQSGKSDITATITRKSSSNIITSSNKYVIYTISANNKLSAGSWQGSFNIGLDLNLKE